MAYIGTQQVQHKAAVLLCLAAGKALLCEKPMGTNSAEVREMVAEARSRGLFLMEVRVKGTFQPPNRVLLAIIKHGRQWTFLEEHNRRVCQEQRRPQRELLLVCFPECS